MYIFVVQFRTDTTNLSAGSVVLADGCEGRQQRNSLYRGYLAKVDSQHGPPSVPGVTALLMQL